MPESTTTSEKLFAARKAKLDRIEQAQRTAFPRRVLRSFLANDAAQCVDDEPSPQVDVAGRIMSLRRMGKTAFAHLRDRSGDIQLFINEKVLGETAYSLMRDTLDVGDFVLVLRPEFIAAPGHTPGPISKTLLHRTYDTIYQVYHKLNDNSYIVRVVIQFMVYLIN